MAVYIDDMRLPKQLQGRPAKWSHLFAHPPTEENVERLHQIARILGLKRSWFQDHNVPHYDVVESKRKLARVAGAIPVTWPDFWRDIVKEKMKESQDEKQR